MNVANEAIILELASTDRTLLEWGDSRGTADNPSHFSNFNIIRCSNCHRLGHVARYYSSLPTHPLVEICIEGVNVVVLLDTGSVKFFINENVHAALDFNNVRNQPVDPGRYISITGDPLNIKCKISCSVRFPKRKMFYQGDFLVSRNIRHECVLGWDFIANNGLTLRAAENNGRHSYFVQGRWDFSHLPRNPQVRDHTCQG